jgi:hypothetical protein
MSILSELADNTEKLNTEIDNVNVAHQKQICDMKLIIDRVRSLIKFYLHEKSNEEKHVNSPLMTPIVSEWLDFFSG